MCNFSLCIFWEKDVLRPLKSDWFLQPKYKCKETTNKGFHKQENTEKSSARNIHVMMNEVSKEADGQHRFFTKFLWIKI